MRKPTFCICKNKVQISFTEISNIQPVAIFCACTALFKSDCLKTALLVSNDAAQILTVTSDLCCSAIVKYMGIKSLLYIYKTMCDVDTQLLRIEQFTFTGAYKPGAMGWISGFSSLSDEL